jgi:hypothetical protein
MDWAEEKFATPADAMREHAWEVGRDHPDSGWVSTPYDVWMPNPHFTGETRPPHPESEEARRIACGELTTAEWEEMQRQRWEGSDSHPPVEDDDLPF